MRLPPEPDRTLPDLAVDIAGLTKVYAGQNKSGGRKALDDVSFDVAPGTFTVLLGLNGAGKSTLFSLVTRLFAARHGKIDILGADVMREPGAALRRLGFGIDQGQATGGVDHRKIALQADGAIVVVFAAADLRAAQAIARRLTSVIKQTSHSARRETRATGPWAPCRRKVLAMVFSD